MAQSDYSIEANPTGLAMRGEVNTIFQSVLTNNSGSTAPTTTAAFMYWVDTSNATTYYLKMRNHDNTNWVVLANYTVATKTLTAVDTTKIPINLSSATLKATPVDADLLPLSDSAASFGLKKLSWANLKATLLTYFDTLYSRTTAIFGIGQTTQDMTASRVLGTTYTNSSGKPIEISVSCFRNSAGLLRIVGYRDGIVTQSSYNELATANVQHVHVSFIVPNGSSYSVSNISGATLNSWIELR